MALSARKDALGSLFSKLAREIRQDMEVQYLHRITFRSVEVAGAMSNACVNIIPARVNTTTRWRRTIRGLNQSMAQSHAGTAVLTYVLSRSVNRRTGEVLGISNIDYVEFNSGSGDLILEIGRPRPQSLDSTYTDLLREYKEEAIIRFYRDYHRQLRGSKIEDLVNNNPAGRIFTRGNMNDPTDQRNGRMVDRTREVHGAHTEKAVGQEMIERIRRGDYNSEIEDVVAETPVPAVVQQYDVWTMILNCLNLDWTPTDRISIELVPAALNRAGANPGDVENITAAVNGVFDDIVEDIQRTGKWPSDVPIEELRGSRTKKEKAVRRGEFELMLPYTKMAGVKTGRKYKKPKDDTKGTAKYSQKNKKYVHENKKKNFKIKNVQYKQKNRGESRGSTSPMALRNIINQYLPQTLKSMMVAPRLVYRTGRFANSVEVTNIMQGSRGGMSAEYTYMKNPYQTFEPGFRMGSTYRDPRSLISGAIREIAIEQMGIKFGQVRRT